MATPELIWCADGNLSHSRIAVEIGYSYGVKLPTSSMLRDIPLDFADQDWKRPNRNAYMQALATHRPRIATVLDWEEPYQYGEVMAWIEEASQFVTECVIAIPKIPGTVPDIPVQINGKEVRVAYSVPTSYGGSTLGLWEFTGRKVHLLGGSPQKQLEISQYVNVASVDGNMSKKMATSRCCYWSPTRKNKGHWVVLEGFSGNAVDECVRRSLTNIWARWNHQ